MSSVESIAIAGIGCRFPGGADDADSFWRLMLEGVDAITEIPADRWSIDKFYDPQPGREGKCISRWGGFVHDPAAFDPEFFGISPREAGTIDPQHKMLLLTAAEALADARQAASPARETREIGVFVGISTHDYSQLQSSPGELDHLDAWSLNSTAATLAANRVSFAFDLSGPSLAVDTACSSSLFAVHLACEAIRRGECRGALAGGANALFHPAGFISFSRAGMLSPTGRCRAFDKSADGFVRSEGAGMIFLLPTSVAREAGLRIYAEILGTAANQDGRKPSMTAPASALQASLIEAACRRADIKPSAVQYVEAHGTGTQAGDPSEVSAIARTVGADRSTPCLLGSVKTNIGHLEAAAGIAGIIKAALCLHHGKVPPNLHFQEANPALDLESGKLRVVTQLEEFDRTHGRIIAGVNSFGFGGANAHAILGEAKQSPDDRATDADERCRLLVISAKNPEALGELAGSYRAALAQEGARADDICLTAGLTQSFLPHRLAICAKPLEFDGQLAAAIEGGSPPGSSRGRAAERAAPPVFVFCGQGSQWAGMGSELLREEPVFAAKLREIDRLIRRNVGWSLIDELARDESSSRLNNTEVAQPAIFAIQMALTALWDHWGIWPSAVVGHSVGEAAAACVGGALTLEEATRVICHRAKSMAACRGLGTMISVASPVTDLQSLISGRAGRVSIGAINSPRSAVLSGRIEDIAQLEEELTAQGTPFRKVRVEYAFHSALMDPARAPLAKALARIRTQPPHLPLFSTVTARESREGDWTADYWWRNIRQPVLFAETIARMLDLGHRTFLEVGPHPVLGGSLLECLHSANASSETRVFSSLKRQKPERETILSSLGALVVGGQQANWENLHPAARRTNLPRHPWKLENTWNEAPASRATRFGNPEHPLLGRRAPEAESVWTSKIQISTQPWLADHSVHTTPVFPASAYLETALAAAKEKSGTFPLCATDLDFIKALTLANEGSPVRLRFSLNLDGRCFEISSSSYDEEGPRSLHVRGQLAGNSGITPPPPTDLEALGSRMSGHCEGAVLRANLARRGLNLGPAFTGHVSVAWCEGEALGHIQLPEMLTPQEGTFLFHPAFLDACFGILFCSFPGWNAPSSTRLFLPVRFDSVRLHACPGRDVWVHSRAVAADSHLLSGDLIIMDESGACLMEIRGFHARAVATGNSAPLLDNALYDEQWIESPLPAEPSSPSSQRVLVLTDLGGTGEALAGNLGSLGAEVIARPALLPLLSGGPFDTIIHCGMLDAETPGQTGTTLAECRQLTEFFRTLALCEDASDLPSRVMVVTRQARNVLPGETANPFQTAACGILRTARLEIPGIAMKIVDLADTSSAELAAETASFDSETESAWRGGVRHVPRLRRSSPGQLRGAQAGISGPVQVVLRQPGPGVELRRLILSGSLPPGHILLRVEAAGVNFRDTMKALGIYPVSSDFDLILGDECAGTILEIGEGVQGLVPGDSVMAVTPGCFATEVVAPAACVVRRPAQLTPAQAATMPVAFLTALYALRDIGRTKPGEKVLIHSAAGGVGLAAVQIAQLLDAEIFATAGSEEKRTMLRGLGIRHVMDSRTLAFRDEMMEATNGLGVDLVLNSLAGEFLLRSVTCLGQGGRFLEIGKRDIYENSSLGLGVFRANQTFSAIDMAQILRDDPVTTQRLLAEIAAFAKEGKLHPLPLRARPLAEVGEALRELAQGKHTGKLVIEVPACPETEKPACPPFRPDVTYLVTGGVRGFGLATAAWLVSRGARHVALVGRSGTTSHETEVVLAGWASAGIDARVFATDLTDYEEVVRLLGEIAKTMPPLRGIIHAATRYESATLQNVDDQNFSASVGPKSLGAWHLDRATYGLPLDFFVLYSSVAGVFGNPGQAAYAAANTFLQGLAARRRASGLPALVVHWGVVSDAGHVADNAAIGTLLENRGLGGMSAAESTLALGNLLSGEAAEAVVARIRWDAEQGGGNLGSDTPRLQELVGQSSSVGGSAAGSARASILALPPSERLAAMVADLTGQLAEVLRLPPESISPSTSLHDLGLDSLIAIETVIRIERHLGISLPQGAITADATVEDLAAKLLQILGKVPAKKLGDQAVSEADNTLPGAALQAHPAASASSLTEDPAHTLEDDNFEENPGVGFFLEWIGLRVAEKFFLGRDISGARTRLARLMPVFRMALRRDWQWSLKNLEIIFGDNLNPRQRRKLAAIAMENHLASYLESGFSHELEFEFHDYLEILELAGGRGVILCGVHLGSWEPFLRWAPDIGLRLAAVYRKARNPLAERIFQERRSRYGIEWIPSNDTKAIAQAVDDRKIVAFMTDLNSYETKLFSDFLGIPASCAMGPYALAALKNAPIIPAVGIRKSVSKVSATFAPALWSDPARPISSEVGRLAHEVNRIFNPWVLEYADQYNWLHPRWRCRPDGSLWTLQTPAPLIAASRTGPCPQVPARVLALLGE